MDSDAELRTAIAGWRAKRDTTPTRTEVNSQQRWNAITRQLGSPVLQNLKPRSAAQAEAEHWKLTLKKYPELFALGNEQDINTLKQQFNADQNVQDFINACNTDNELLFNTCRNIVTEFTKAATPQPAS